MLYPYCFIRLLRKKALAGASAFFFIPLLDN